MTYVDFNVLFINQNTTIFYQSLDYVAHLTSCLISIIISSFRYTCIEIVNHHNIKLYQCYTYFQSIFTIIYYIIFFIVTIHNQIDNFMP